MPHKLQAIIFDNKKWDHKSANEWLNKHHYIPIKELHETTNFIRARINKPCARKPNNYYTVKLPNSIEMIFCN